MLSGTCFFQGEDGIRFTSVTGVQTCALPICRQVARQRAHLKIHPYKAKLRSLPGGLSATQTSKPEPRIRPSRKSASHRSNLCSLEKPFWVVLQEYCSSNEVPILRIDMRSR